MKMLEQKATDFIEVLSSKEPVPGGGGACAAVGAFGMALGLMVANLTTGKKKYAASEKRIQEILKEAKLIQDYLVDLADEDARAFEPLSQAYRLPRNTQSEIEQREKVMEQCLYRASKTPLQIMERIMESIDLLEELAVIGSTMAISDVGVGIQFAKAALNGASLNVFINTRLMKERKIAEEFNEKAEFILKLGNEKADTVFYTVRNALK